MRDEGVSSQEPVVGRREPAGLSTSAIGRTVHRLWGSGSERPAGVSAYEQVTRERVDGLADQVDRIELKINGLLLALVAAVVGELYRMVVR